MTLLSSLLSLQPIIPEVQSGFLNGISPSTGSGEDVFYYNVTISAVSAVANCAIFLYGGFADANLDADPLLRASGAKGTYIIHPRLTSTTNLRISCATIETITTPIITARWQVIDFGS